MDRLRALASSEVSRIFVLLLSAVLSAAVFFIGYQLIGKFFSEITIFGLSVGLVVLMFYRPMIAIYLLILVLPFNGVRVISQLRYTELIALIFFIAYFWRIVLGREKKLTIFSPIIIVLLLFLVSFCLSSFNSLLPTISFKRTLIFSYLVLLSWTVSQQLRSHAEFINVVRVWLVSSGVFGLYGIYQFFSPSYRLLAFANVWNVGGLPRVTLFYGDPNLVCGYLVVSLLLCLILLSRKTYLGIKPWIIGLISGVSIVTILLTLSRSGLLAMLGGLAVIALLSFTRQSLLASIKWLSVVLICSLVIFLSVPGVQRAVSPVFDRLSNITDTSVSSVGARIVAYNEAINMTLEHPLFGVGPDMFPYQYDKRTGILAPEPHVVAHSLILETVSEKGFLGLFCFATLFFALFYNLFRVRSDKDITPEQKAITEWLIASFVSFLILTLFLTGLYEVYLWLLIGMTMALAGNRLWQAKE